MKLEDLTTEQQEKISEFGLNTWYVLELLDEYNSNKTRTGMGLFVCSVSDRDSGLRVTDRRFHGLMGRNDW